MMIHSGGSKGVCGARQVMAAMGASVGAGNDSEGLVQCKAQAVDDGCRRLSNRTEGGGQRSQQKGIEDKRRLSKSKKVAEDSVLTEQNGT